MEIVGDYEYSKKDLIGHGAFAVVFKGRIRKRHDKTVAIKSITKKNIAKSQNLLTKEIKILKELSDLHHDNVVQLMECKETTNHVYLVMEYCNGGDLADYLQVKGTLSEDTISQFLRQIAGAMRALNAKGIVHRDMKPQNILLCYPPGKKNPPASQINLKIADFGFARFLQDGVMAATLCGSPMYMAPEVIMSIQYDAKADLWSIGTIVFQCLTGKAPFQAQTPQQLKQFYEKNLQLKPNVPSGTSSELKDLLYKLLKRNAKDRIDFEDFFIHPFLRSHSPAASSSPVPVPGRSPSFSSDSPASLKAVSASPLSGKMEEYASPIQTKMRSPHKLERVEAATAHGHGSPSEVAGFIKVTKDVGHDSRCSTPTEDFVMVPDEMSSDQSSGTEDRASKMSLDDGHGPESINTVTVTPDAGEALYHKDSAGHTHRPSSLQVASPDDKSPPPSAPIPVPSQRAVYTRLQTNSPTSPGVAVGKTAEAVTHKHKELKKNESGLVRRSSENNMNAPNIGSLSPPVQFSIGTPPNNSGQAWRRSSVSNSPGRHGTTPPSPLKKSGSVPAHLSPVQYTGPGSLATIIDSPVKAPTMLHYPNLNETKGVVSNASYQRHHPYNVPENMQTLEYNGNVPTSSTVTVQTLHNQSDVDMRPGYGGTSLLSQQLFTAAFGDSPNRDVGRTVIPFAGGSGGRIRKSSSSSEKSGSMERDRSSGCLHQGASLEASPPSIMYAQSPSNMEGPITFVAPELAEETIMDDAHNAIMAKLNFVLDLVECIMDVARVRGAPLNAFTESFNCNKGEGVPDNVPKFTEAQRRLEQLILHVRSLHLLSSALQLARDEIKTGKLTVSNSLKTVVRQMNEHYHTCVSVSRQLQQRLGASVQTALSPQIVIATADKLIYNYAIEMCQTAALDELFGNPQECFRRYQTAQILLHSLAQQSRNSSDKESLNKYKEAVERRLCNLQGQNLYHQHVSS